MFIWRIKVHKWGAAVVLLSLLLCVQTKVWGQAIYGTTGLLHAPTADMQRDKTFMLGGGHINKWSTSSHFHSSEVGYTWNYYLNVTIFPWLEVGYTCTLVHADHGSSYFPQQSWGKFTNQDRAFYGRLRLWKEGWWKDWTPQIVVGLDDPATHSSYGGGGITTGGDSGNNNYLTRYYLAMTKHVEVKNVGELGAHLSFIIGNSLSDPHYKRPAAGVNFQFDMPDKDRLGIKLLNGLNVMAEYYPVPYKGENGQTTCGVNIGAQYKIWKDHINLWCEHYDLKHFSWGVFFKIHLK